MYRRNASASSSVLDAARAVADLSRTLTASYVSARLSTLGGENRASTIITVSLDPKSAWTNGVLQNSRYALFSVHPADGTIELFSGSGIPKFRKAQFKTPAEAVAKIEAWVGKARMSARSNPRVPRTLHPGKGTYGAYRRRPGPQWDANFTDEEKRNWRLFYHSPQGRATQKALLTARGPDETAHFRSENPAHAPRHNPGFGDYLAAGRRHLATGLTKAAEEAQRAAERARAAADREAKRRQCDAPTPEQAIRVLAQAVGVAKLNPRKKTPYGPKFNRDGTVTLWDVYTQSWDRTSQPSDRDLASLDAAERARVIRHLKLNPRKNAGQNAPGLYPISSLKKGEFFKRKPDARKVYVKGDYDRSERTYTGTDTEDISRAIYLKGTTRVYVGFDY